MNMYRIAKMLRICEEIHYNDKESGDRCKIRLRRIRTAFPLESYDIDITSMKQFQEMKRHVVQKQFCWEVVEKFQLEGRSPIYPGDRINTMTGETTESLDHVSEKHFPICLRGTKEGDDSDATPHRLMVVTQRTQKKRVSEDFSPYDTESHLDAVRTVSIVPFAENMPYVWKRMTLFFFRTSIKTKQEMEEELIWTKQPSYDGHPRRSLLDGWLRGSRVVPIASPKKSPEPDQVPRWGEFKGYLDPRNVTFILDIGTGQVGFYCFQYDSSNNVIMKDYKKYDNKGTFFENFLDDKNGAAEFAELISKRFGEQIR